MTVELEGDTQKSVFEAISQFQEVFEETACGKCDSERVRFIVREVDGNQYFELRCLDCGARLAFGQHRQGGSLFPVRKAGKDDKSGLEEGTWLPSGGWMRWDNKQGKTV